MELLKTAFGISQIPCNFMANCFSPSNRKGHPSWGAFGIFPSPILLPKSVKKLANALLAV
jgi:hypothetical protein